MLAFCSTRRMVAPAALSSREHAVDLLHQDRREPHRRLVEQQRARAAHQRARHGQHLLLAARERAAGLLEPLAQAREDVEHAVEVARDTGLVAAGPGAEAEVLAHGEVAEDAAPLGHLGHAEPHTALGGRAPRGRGRRGSRGRSASSMPGDGPQGGRLPRPVGADEGEDLALADRKEIPLTAAMSP